MEDENGIELSLGLSCGGSAGKSKGKDGNPLDTKTEEGNNSNKVMDDLKSFIHTSIQKQGSDNGSQRSDPAKSQDNFFTNLAKSAVGAEASVDLRGNNSSQFSRYGGIWVANSNRSAEIEEEKSDHHVIGGKLWPEAPNKRKMLFDEINHQKKHEREVQHADPHAKNPPVGNITSTKTSHISVTTEDGSALENEDVTESEAEGSTSRLVLHHEDSNKRYRGVGGSSEVPKESHGFTDSSVMEVQGQNQSKCPQGNESKLGNLTYGVPLSLQPHTVTSVPYSLPLKVPNSASAPSMSGYSLPCVMQLMPPANSERPGTHSVNPGHLPLTFGYSPVQLPTLRTDHSWGAVSHPPQFTSSCAGGIVGGVITNSDKPEDGLKISQAVVQAPPRNSSEVLPFDNKAPELVKGGGKQHAAEEGGASSSSQTEDEVKENIMTFRPKEASDQPVVEGFPHEVSAIRPGIAADVKFGGCGSHPNLPWVSTTGPGPNGRTISGVTYRYSRNQIRIVCACHGSHMSPEEFVQHASSDHNNPESTTGLASFPSSNPAASAPS
ncbi:hypothetical protein HHK36_014162 [Tetracentron sinense]|uniref:Ninja-family protein n=1 Tax=Tetracentron sinense TaxID=13715 RepID=A0A834Z4L0_TETSI|nr:hypothetical protein HHK36_014162 [Tetracentron sinense]